MTMKEFIFENYYKWISFTENDDPIKVKPYHELFLKEKLKKTASIRNCKKPKQQWYKICFKDYKTTKYNYSKTRNDWKIKHFWHWIIY